MASYNMYHKNLPFKIWNDLSTFESNREILLSYLIQGRKSCHDLIKFPMESGN